MGVNSLLKTVTRQRRDCDLKPGPSPPEASTLTTLLPSRVSGCWNMPGALTTELCRCLGVADYYYSRCVGRRLLIVRRRARLCRPAVSRTSEL